MEVLIGQLLIIAQRMWKYRWVGLIVAWVTGMVGAVVVFVLPDRYEASARIYVDTQSILKPLMSGLAVQPNVEQQVTMLSRTLISRPNVEKLVRMADLDLKNQSKGQQEATIETVTTNLSIQSSGRDNLYILGYRDSDPETAKRVVQSLVSIFVESSLGAQRKDTSTATTFLNEQIKSYEAKLQEAETRLKEFRLKNLSNMAGDGKDSAARLSELSTQLERARLEYREALNARDAAKAQLDAEKARGGAQTTQQSLMQEANAQVATPELDARLAEYRRNLDALLQRYTDQHPDIISTRKLIKDLEDQRKRELAELRKAAAATPSVTMAGAGGSMAAQELVRILATTEVQVASLKARVDEYSSRYAQAVAALKTAPQMEAEAAQLNRDYAIQKKNYEDLVQRREQASLSGELDVASGIADFRVIDPPRANPKPVAPNRLLLLAGAMAGALAIGFFTTFAASQLRPVFHDGNDLRARVELPILGVVTRLVTDADRARQRVDLIRFAAGAGGLLVMFAVALTILAVQLSRQVV
ncbi:XrtA system polysaccharide chain length determinant [Roseateles saccharophilus]|uniref:Polysaccharide chain length determinant protein (PEP-CTERM system associated) n=1 Tax=Roseateles saccharophilus TaxID=304 RepID=A0A4R3U6K8_ROSSA|nr:XrtA system polysaccharide chain length determinant [Roseateles saccharophilus]MDG0836050.1 chain length-determining protein [Roseateles saccharophilus]TCU82159.1 polysaccharide chain length determinant protein (PEP-CTERM system associated) [Roseateles saccharophilus]